MAGIGNTFLGDDGFGVAVVRRLAQHPRLGVAVRDFGIRSLDLAYEILEGYDRVILVDAIARGGQPGTLYVLEPPPDDRPVPAPETHNLGAAAAVGLARSLGAAIPFLRVVGCEPAVIPPEGDLLDGLSDPVAAAVEPAVRIVEKLLANE